MFNLLVSSNENDWNGEPFVLERSRCVSEYTDPEIAARFGELNAEQVRELCSLPCVFAYENQCAKDPKFGVLRSVKARAARDVRIEYSIMPCEQFATAPDLESMGRLLDIHGFEMNRAHWAVKDVDLARELALKGMTLPGWASAPRRSVDIERHTFDVALSFPGEHRSYVDRVAEELDYVLGAEACFYDRFYEAQLARPNLDVLLQEIYGERSGLVVVFVCGEYDAKLWCGIEWRKIRERGAAGIDREIMYVRLGEGEVAGLTRVDGYLDARERSPEEVARMIVERVRLGSGGVRGTGQVETERPSPGRGGEGVRTSRGGAALGEPRSADLMISGTVTDAMRQRFLTAAFDFIADNVENSAKALQAAHVGSVEYIASRIDATSFEATLFVGGRRRGHCGIWLTTGGEPGLGVGICYSAQGVGNRNEFNEMLTVGDAA
ncbi:MAG: TIR domain-containing protein [Gammaproteobacteria bacterium]|nr:TIR domain-containing protein [Gammaproteobacteria bacterium]